MRILGLDPGLTRCGVSVVTVDSSRRYTMDYVSVVRTAADLPLAQRLVQLETALTEVFSRYEPDAMALERVFSQVNVRTVMGTAQASAVALLCAGRSGIPAFMYTPTEVKAAVTGYGKADKSQVTTMVTRILHLMEPPKPADAADALALALCHGMKGINHNMLKDAQRIQATKLSALIQK